MRREDVSAANVAAESEGFVQRPELDETRTASLDELACRSSHFRSDDALRSFGHHDAPALPRGGLDERPSTEPGVVLGRYLVISELGRGGMGVVSRAYDPKLQREVALKRLHSANVSPELQARMVREAQAMAKLNHSHVVSVYDFEAPGDDVLLAMEYVDGCDLRRWLESKRSPREILDMFAQAGRGLQAAHEAGLLHRDFKPANVLVTRGGIAKVTDFGLARLDDACRSDGTSDDPTPIAGEGHDAPISGLLTAAGIVLGTPAYMAPEQHRGGPLSPAVDQYAFCVALWQALTGALPFPERRERPLLKRKLEGPPPWPRPQPNLPSRVLDAIARGLSPNPSHRWPSMAHLLQVLAYDSRRQRNRAYAMAAAAISVSLGAASLHAWGAARAERCSGADRQLEGIWGTEQRRELEDAILGIEAPYATATWSRTEQVLDQFAADWRTSYTEACEATLRREQSTEVMDMRMGCLQRAKVHLEAAVEVLSAGDAEVVQNADKVIGDLPDLGLCGDIDRLQAEVEPPSEGEAAAVDAARAHVAQARALYNAGKFHSAAEALNAARRALGPIEYGPVQLELAAGHAATLERLGDYTNAELAWREALRRAIAQGTRPDIFRAANGLAVTLGLYVRKFDAALEHRALLEGAAVEDPRSEATLHRTLGLILLNQGKYEEAEARLRAALELLTDLLGTDDRQAAIARTDLGGVLFKQGKHDEAEAEHRAALELLISILGPDHPEIAVTRSNLAGAMHTQGRHEEAEAEIRTALGIDASALGPDHPAVAASRSNLAIVLLDQGKYEEAEAEVRKALDDRARALGPDHPEVAESRGVLGVLLDKLGRHQEADAALRGARESLTRTLGPDHPDVALAREQTGTVLRTRGDYEAAEAEFRAALAIRSKVSSPDLLLAGSHSFLGDVLRLQGDDRAAEIEFRTALRISEMVLGSNHPGLVAPRVALAAVLLELQRPTEALPLAEQAWSRAQLDETDPQTQAEVAFVLARSSWATNRSPEAQDRARELAGTARQIYRELGPAHADELVAVESWMKHH